MSNETKITNELETDGWKVEHVEQVGFLLKSCIDKNREVFLSYQAVQELYNLRKEETK